jgi:hypothetical protein
MLPEITLNQFRFWMVQPEGFTSFRINLVCPETLKSGGFHTNIHPASPRE